MSASHPPARLSAALSRCSAAACLLCLALALALALALGLSACSRDVRPPPPAGSGPPDRSSLSAPDLRTATVFIVEPAASVVDVEVRRGGVLARLGHDHVLSSRSLAGRVWLQADFRRSGLDLSLPVAELIVDDPQRRRAAGKAFPPEIPQADREATRDNMLGGQVLDAGRYPRILLRAVAIDGGPQATQAMIRISIKEISRDVPVPVRLSIAGDRLVASGEFDLLQSDFGIEPFSAAFGALKVQDRLHLRFRIVAARQRAPSLAPDRMRAQADFQEASQHQPSIQPAA